ncbi:MAG: UDP-glucose/GDP-mannose dehydrogenase family protein [Candidatus Dependentiae bacterium]|nr:UDP-glucose/GDP-mannose dehydrogenase family protein [Candidatus Dependentiae bacterium]
MKLIKNTFTATLYIGMLLIQTMQATSKQDNKPLNVTIVGTGYVGLVTGACLAEFGNTVLCVDINTQKIIDLKNGVIPIYEPGLDTIVAQNVQSKRLTFTDDLASAIKQADVIFIAVGTPMSENGAADLSYVEAVARTIAKHINSFKVIVTKSTVPIGTGAWIKQIILDNGIKADQFAIVSNPEFLREGSAINDFLFPDRIVIGTSSAAADTIMRSIYEHLLNQDVAYVSTNVVTAESIKYASNAFLATKISFINELANLCDETGADVQVLAHALGLDKRINKHFLNPGPGFGGSCFPKDTQALLYTSQQYGIDIHTVLAALKANEIQKEIPVKKLLPLMENNVKDKIVAILGLAFKANTDDVRYSPAISTINKLIEYGASIRAYDPQAMKSMKTELPNITYCTSIADAVTNADAVIVMTEWDEFKAMDLELIGSLLKTRILVDARNILDPSILHKHGFIFDNIGRSCLCKLPLRNMSV